MVEGPSVGALDQCVAPQKPAGARVGEITAVPDSSARHTRDRGLLPSLTARPGVPNSAVSSSPNGSRHRMDSSFHAVTRGAR